MPGRQPGRFALMRSISVWSLLWGAAMGWLLLAPAVVESHRLIADSGVGRVTLAILLTAVFSATGLVAGIVGGTALVVLRALAGEIAQPGWAWCLGTPPAMAGGYVALSLLLRAAGLGAYRGERLGTAALASVLGAVAGATVMAAFVYRRTRDRAHPAWHRALGWTLAALILLGAGVRVPHMATPPTIGQSSLAVIPAVVEPAGRTLLVVGVDSLTPRVVDAVRATRHLEFWDRFATQGRRAIMRAPWPPYWSTPAWAAILTGSPIQETGLSNDLFVEVPGLPAYALPFDGPLLIGPVVALELVLARARLIKPVPPSASVLRRPPIWRLLRDAGIPTAVVRFPFSHPASGQATYTISSRTGSDEFVALGVRPNSGTDLVSPRELDPYVDRFFGAESPVAPAVFEEVLPDAVMARAPRGLLTDDREMVRLGLDIDARTLAAAGQLLRDHRDIRAMFVYLSGFDTVCHHLWRYRFPEDFTAHPVPDPSARAIGDTMDRYLTYLDRELKRLAACLPSDPTVIVLSDHGHEATTQHPLFSGWHSPDAVFMEAGPGVAPVPGGAWQHAEYDDVIDTLLGVFGLARGRPADRRESGPASPDR